jgi:hypothetical protein
MSLYYCPFTFFGLQPEGAARSGATILLPSHRVLSFCRCTLLQLMNSEHRPFDELRCGINEPFYLPFGNAIHHTALKLLQPLCADWRPTIGAELSAGHDFWL